jgi:hypothetical protein
MSKNKPAPAEGVEFPPGKVPERKNRLSVAQHANDINESFNKGTAATIEVAMRIAAAVKQLNKKRQTALIALVPFTASTFSKYGSIGSNRLLCAPEYLAKVPSGLTILYELSQVDDDEKLKRALEDGTIHPKMKRKEATEWANEGEEPIAQKPPKPADPKKVVETYAKLSAEGKEEFAALIRALDIPAALGGAKGETAPPLTH